MLKRELRPEVESDTALLGSGARHQGGGGEGGGGDRSWVCTSKANGSGLIHRSFVHPSFYHKIGPEKADVSVLMHLVVLSFVQAFVAYGSRHSQVSRTAPTLQEDRP